MITFKDFIEKYRTKEINAQTEEALNYYTVFYERFCEIEPFITKTKGPILSIGAAFGLFEIYLTQVHNKQVFCLEHPSQKNVLCSYLKDGKINIVLADLEYPKLPFKNKSIETILFMDVIEHLAEPVDNLMLELNRIIKNNGNIILTTPNRCRLPLKISNFFLKKTEIFNSTNTMHHKKEYTKNELENLVKNNGFNIYYSKLSKCLDSYYGLSYSFEAPFPKPIKVFIKTIIYLICFLVPSARSTIIMVIYIN